MKNHTRSCILFFLLTIGLGISFYNLPPIKSRLDWRLDELRAKIKYAISPPEQVVFVPQEQKKRPVQATPTPAATPHPPQPESPLTPTSTSAPTSTTIPDRIRLNGFRHEYQGWNNCGPATLSMALSFWGWKGDQYDIAPLVKPDPRDKNVMPAELANYVENLTQFKVVYRVGGEIDLLKRLVAAGYPVIVEKGFESPKFDGWMGHYELITGYDNGKKSFLAQDSYFGPDQQISYETLESYWRAFNFTYLVVFPTGRGPEMAALLGPQFDETQTIQFAAQKARDEILILTGRDVYFAWFNLGTNLVALQDYAEAAEAYDQAFAVYPSIPKNIRPWRMLWYQTGPYQAYYFSGRYQDVIDLATETLKNMSEPVLEESYYWMALAREALGDKNGAMDDLQQSLKYHPGFGASLSALQLLNVLTPVP